MYVCKCGCEKRNELDWCECCPSGGSDGYQPFPAAQPSEAVLTGYYLLHSKLFAACLKELHVYIAAIYYGVEHRPSMTLGQLKHATRSMKLIQDLMYLKPPWEC